MSPAPRSPERFRERRGPLVVLGSARGAGLRVSFHYYNIPEDVETLLRVLERNEELIAGVASRR